MGKGVTDFWTIVSEWLQLYCMDKHSPWWVSVSALLGAGAALALPGPTGPATAIASVLIIGALALLAGHTWGLLVVTSANVLLIGHL